MVGADSRTSRGDFVTNRLANKITPLADSIVVARSGSAAGWWGVLVEGGPTTDGRTDSQEENSTFENEKFQK